MDAFHLKLLARQGLKLPLLLRGLFRLSAGNGIYFLIYHRVSGDLPLEIDLPWSLFRRQLEFLARARRVIRYDEALDALRLGQPLSREAFVLTFDDAYEDFYTRVFPLLRDLELPASLFVTTGFAESGIPYPIQRHGVSNVKPADWEMLGEMMASGLVTLGAHTHTHPILTNIPRAQQVEELAKPRELFRARLGLDIAHFAYPKALWSETVEALVAEYYASAAILEQKKAMPGHFHPYRIPRIPIRRSDGWLFFLAKIRGWLEGEETLYQRLKAFNHR